MSLRGNLERLGLLVPGNRTATFDGVFKADNLVVPDGNIYYVDNRLSASGNGSSWARAFITLQEAITASNADIDWAADNWLVNNYIYVAPGVYAEELTPAYSCTIIGMGVLGTDTCAEVHPTSGSALTGTLLGAHIINMCAK